MRSILFAISAQRPLARPSPRPRREAAARAREQRAPWARLGVCFLHLAVLSSLGLAQPLFDILGRNPEFFAVRGSPSRDILAFALAVTLVPPTVLLIPEALAALISRRLHAGVHLLFIAALSAVLALQVVKRVGSFSTTASLAAALVLGTAAALAYARFRFTRLTLTALAPVPLVFLALFLLGTPVKKLVLPEEEKLRLASVSSRTPIIVVVFDELPITSLMERSGGIDAVRYPNFAALARDSVWFRNTAAVSGGTVRAVPAIVTGVYSTRGLPIYADYPRNLFTLLGRRYRIRASEQMTRLCPPELCGNRPLESFSRRTESLSRDVGIVYLHLLLPDGLRDRLPPISDTWLNFGRETAAAPPYAAPATRRRRKATPVADRASSFERFVDSIRPSRRPALHYLHVLLPHQPWHYFPSGREYLTHREILRPSGEDGRWPTERTSVRQAFQRHLLQVQYVDRLLGRLLARLRKVGMYDGSLVVVTSDHGVSFRPGDRRRKETPTNVEDMAPVPLFVKLPGRRQGEVEDRHVQTTDILPTIADVIGTPIPWRLQGRSAFTGPSRERIRIGPMTLDGEVLERRRERALARQIALFGSGKALRLYGVGPHPELLGKRVAALPNVTASTDRADVATVVAERLSDVRRKERVVPAPLAGTVTGPGAAEARGIAAAVNGRIAAVSETFSDSGTVGFSMLVPDWMFRPGENRVELFWIADGPGGVVLESLGGFPS